MDLTQGQCELILGSKFAIMATAGSNDQPWIEKISVPRVYDNIVVVADYGLLRARDNVAANSNICAVFHDAKQGITLTLTGTGEYVKAEPNTSKISTDLPQAALAMMHLASFKATEAQKDPTKLMIDEIAATAEKQGKRLAGVIIVTVNSAAEQN
ncbi:MAG: pyridoxamine 5'-phosphate oxidase family protein [Firmicutes bacterium]|nr:pyridoxamine 5'-phosphate oxidase family protein [Bacillota bacterium]